MKLAASDKNPLTAPVELKVAAGSAAAMISGVITWVLVTFVPAFNSGLPAPLATFLPWMVSLVLSGIAAWSAPHTPRPGVTLSVRAGAPEPKGVR